MKAPRGNGRALPGTYRCRRLGMAGEPCWSTLPAVARQHSATAVEHPHLFRLDQLDRAPDHDRALHRRPRHPVRGGDLGLIPAVLHSYGQRGPQPGGGAHPCRDQTCSVNVCRSQTSVRHRQRRLRHNTTANSPPDGRSCGRVSTQSLPDVETDPHAGHLAASGSSVTSCTILTRVRCARHAPPPDPRVPTSTTHHRYGRPRPVALLSLLLNTARIKEPRAANAQARRTDQPQVARSRSKSPFSWVQTLHEPGAVHSGTRGG
jgi:hypothetical protein